MKNKKSKILSAARLILQIILFIFLPTLYIESLNGVKQIYLAILHQNFSTNLLPQLVAVLLTIPATIFLGRFFCGWMCAFGSFTDFIYLIFSKLFKRRKKIRINEKADKWMKGIKYVILIILIVAVWSFNVTIFSTVSPWDAFGMLATIGKAPDFSYVIANLTAGFVILVAILAASAFIERFFCRYLCPMGAIFAIASKLRIAKIKKTTDKCGTCRICTNNCAMGIPLYKTDKVNSGECINCMKCVGVCPRGNVSFAVAQGDVRPLIAGTATVAVMTGLYYVGNLATSVPNLSTAPAASQSSLSSASSETSSKKSVDIFAPPSGTSSANAASSSQSAASQASKAASSTTSGKYKDGTYQGSGTGFRGGTTSVSVIVSGGKITAINVDSYGDDRPFFERAYSGVAQAIVSSQSANVDAVSGATYSSNGIMQAVENALSKA